MKKTFILFFLLNVVMVTSLFSQATCIIDSLPAYTPPEDSIYIAGDFNGWNPGDPVYVLHKNPQIEDKWTITFPAQPEGTTYQYKFTRGSWETVEKGPMGEEIPNRQFTFGNDDTVHIIIYNWRDYGGGGITAAANVTMMSDSFYMPQLNRTRRIWLYLPPDYDSTMKSYPVLYMHDGQNLFDAFTSYAGEWQVDETLNTLAEQGYQVPIVVGIDNGGLLRIDEYSPWVNPAYGGGEGGQYIAFIVETLKPYIDAHYRTLPGREHTGIMGSSLGGLISHYGALKFQEVFSKAGLFSPSYWFSDTVWSFTREAGKHYPMAVYQMCGDQEGAGTVNDMLAMQDSLISCGFDAGEVYSKVVAGGFHNEALWRQEFRPAYLWLFGSWANGIEEPVPPEAVTCFPNPSGDMLELSGREGIAYDSAVIFDMGGHQVKNILHLTSNRISIRDLQPGTYLIRCYSNERIFSGKFIKK